MSPVLRKRSELPPSATFTVDLVENLGFPWAFDYDYPTPPNTERRVQIRDDAHYAPKDQVIRYAASMKRGEKFAPIVVTKDGFLVDGNTRVEASIRNSFPTLHAIVIDENWDGASEGVKSRLHVLGAAFNVRNGKGIDRREIAAAVRALAADDSYDSARIATLLGVTDRMAQDIIAEKRARDRAEREGVDLNGSIPTTQLRQMGKSSSKLNRAPFMELLRLVQDAGLSTGDLSDLIGRVHGAQQSGSDDDALRLIEAERAARREQIQEFRARGKAKPAQATMLRQRLGFLLGFEEAPSKLVEHSPSLAGKHMQMIDLSIRLLQRVRTAQESAVAVAADSADSETSEETVAS